jgi:hypothetical protein
MPYQIRFKVTEPDSLSAPLEDEVVCIDFEPANLDENLRRLIRSRINLEVMMRDLHDEDGYWKAFQQSGVVPVNYWAPEPMDICKGEYNAEAGIVLPKGKYGPRGEWIPDYIVASAPAMDSLLEALLDDDERVTNKIVKSSDPG